MDVESEMMDAVRRASDAGRHQLIGRPRVHVHHEISVRGGRLSLAHYQPTSPDMRPLTEDESKAVFSKLANYIVSACALYRRSTPD